MKGIKMSDDLKDMTVLSTAMRSWDYDDPQSDAHGETWAAEVTLDNAQSRLTVFLTDAHGRKQEIAIEINGQQVSLYANTDTHHDAPLLSAKIGQNEAYVFESQNTTSQERIIRIDENGFAPAKAMEFTDAPAPAAKR